MALLPYCWGKAFLSAVHSGLGKLLLWEQLSVAWGCQQQNCAGKMTTLCTRKARLVKLSVSINSGLSHLGLPSRLRVTHKWGSSDCGIWFKSRQNASLHDTAQLLVVFCFEHLRLLKLAEEGKRKDCFIFLQIVPIFTWQWVTGGPDRRVALLCTPASSMGSQTAPIATGCLRVSDTTVCFLRPFLNRGPKRIKQKDFCVWGCSPKCHASMEKVTRKSCLAVLIFWKWIAPPIYPSTWKPSHSQKKKWH